MFWYGDVKIERGVYPAKIMPYLVPEIDIENMKDNGNLFGRRGDGCRCAFENLSVGV
jgi:hypothetical protein